MMMFLLVASELLGGVWDSLLQLDAEVLLALNGLHTPFFDVFMKLFTGKFIWVPMYAAILYVLWRNMSLRQVVVCAVCMAMVILLADQGTSLLKHAVERLRPANLENPISAFVHVVDGYRGGRYGFPSSHAANSFGLALFMLYVFRRGVQPYFLLGWALVNCYTRIYLGVHYPGDILCGAVIGLLVATALYALFVRFSGYKAGDRPVGQWLPVVVGVATVAVISVLAAASLLS